MLIRIAGSLLLFSTLASAADSIDIPHLAALTIDGDDTDWQGAGLALLDPAEDGFMPADPADISAQARVAWTDDGLAVLVTVHDDRWVETDEARVAFEADSVELFLRPGSEWKELVQPVICPGMAGGHPELRSYVWDYRGAKEAWADAPLGVTAARQRIDGGYRLEALIPWVSIRFAAKPGATCEFRINVNDKDPGTPRRQLSWLAPDGNAFHLVRLADGAGVALDGGAWVAIDAELTEAAANAVGPLAAAGQPVALRQGATVLASGVMVADGARAAAHLAVPLSSLVPKQPVEVLVDGAVAATAKLADPREQARGRMWRSRAPRRWVDEDAARETQRYLPQAQQVFSRTALPVFAFAEPRLMRLAGVTGLTVAYYDAGFAEVTEATRPGRYGAVLTIGFAKGEPLRLERTLYRRPDGPEPQLPLTGEFAQALGLPAQAAGSDELRRAFGHRWNERLLGDDGAVALAGIAEAASNGEAPRPDFQARAWWYALDQKLAVATRYEAFPFLPKGYEADAQKRWPAIIYLHGSGDYPPLEKRNRHGDLIGYAEGQPDFPFVVLAVQSFGWWESPAVAEFTRRALTDYRIDPDRVYLMGFSMGGYGTWSTAVDYPELFAAGVPMGGGRGREGEAARVAELPLWVFNGDDDNTTTLADAHVMADAVHAAGGRLRLTAFPGVGHLGTQEATFATAGLWDWLLQQKRGAPQELKAMGQQPKATTMGPPRP